MADRNLATGGQPLVKIGHYILGETLGVGTFGKVKSEYFHSSLLKRNVDNINLPLSSKRKVQNLK